GERRAGFALRDQGAFQHAALERGPGVLAADLADDARADRGAPGALLHLRDHLLREAVHAALVVAWVLVFLDVVAAAHDDVAAGRLADADEALRVGVEAADREFDDRVAARG